MTTTTTYNKSAWLGNYPAHWKVLKLKHIGFLYGGLSGKTGEDFLNEKNFNGLYIPFTSICNDMTVKSTALKPVVIYEDENQNEVLKNDLFFLMSSENFADIGKTAILLEDLEKVYLNSFCKGFRITNTEVDAKFLNYCLNSNHNRQLLAKEGNGFTRINLRKNNVMSFEVALPPYQEQIQIAHYLDTQTQKINHFITKKQQFIALLKEQRQSVINEAVTKGLNYDSSDFYDENDLNAEKKNQKNQKNQKNHSSDKRRMKDSGIKWLGNIPEHWEVRKISYSFELIGSGTTPESGNDKFYSNGEYYWINSGDLDDGIVETTEKKVTQLAIEKHSTLKLYQENSLIVAMYGATIGKTGLTKIIGCTNQACCVLSNSTVFNIEFVQFWFMGNRHILLSMSYGGGQPNISQEVIKQLRITCPPLSEQTQIVNHIKAETATIDTAIAKAEREIELIKEYKEAMIAEAVMGKVKMSEL